MPTTANFASLIDALKGELSIRGEVIGFNMSTFVGSRDQHADLRDHKHGVCRTIACIAGTCYLLATNSAPMAAMQADPDEIERIAAEFLGLDPYTAAELFYDLPDQINLSEITIEQAISTVEHLAATGVVSWVVPPRGSL